MTRAAFDAWLRDHGGSIVNISAPFEQRGVVYQAHVAAAKSGVDSLTRTCAVEWGPYGIRVNAIAPGSMLGHRGAEAVREAVPGQHRRRPTNPLGRHGHGSDVAYLALFLCSPLARFVSGQVIAVDGAGVSRHAAPAGRAHLSPEAARRPAGQGRMPSARGVGAPRCPGPRPGRGRPASASRRSRGSTTSS